MDPKAEKKLTDELVAVYYENEEFIQYRSKKYQRIALDTIDPLIEAMRGEDDLFKRLYQCLVYTGSYWEKLQVQFPPEFDINMVLSLPFEASDIELTELKEEPAFLTYRLKRDVRTVLETKPNWEIHINKLEKFFDDDLILRRQKVKSWVQGVITKAMNSTTFKVKKPEMIEIIEMSECGPGFTFYITLGDDSEFCVDFVPVIDGHPDGINPIPPQFYLSPRHRKFINGYHDWFLVPKRRSAKFSTNNNEKYWRISFPEAEKKLLLTDEYCCVTKLIKLIKMLRDAQEFYTITSYHIKTLFLLELDDYPDPNKWQQKDMGSLMLKMLRKLQTALEHKHLSFYYQREFNLLGDMADDDAKNRANRIKIIIRDLLAKPETAVRKYFRKQTIERTSIIPKTKSDDFLNSLFKFIFAVLILFILSYVFAK